MSADPPIEWDQMNPKDQMSPKDQMNPKEPFCPIPSWDKMSPRTKGAELAPFISGPKESWDQRSQIGSFHSGTK